MAAVSPISGDGACEFCAIVLGDVQPEIVYEDANTIAFVPLEPAGPGHTLVIPREHIACLWELSDEVAGHVIRTVTRVAVALHEVLDPEGMNLINSSGEAATQTVFHLHMHLVPRWVGDHMGAIWPPSSHWGEPNIGRTAERLRDVLTNSPHC